MFLVPGGTLLSRRRGGGAGSGPGPKSFEPPRTWASSLRTREGGAPSWLKITLFGVIQPLPLGTASSQAPIETGSAELLGPRTEFSPKHGQVNMCSQDRNLSVGLQNTYHEEGLFHLRGWVGGPPYAKPRGGPCCLPSAQWVRVWLRGRQAPGRAWVHPGELGSTQTRSSQWPHHLQCHARPSPLMTVPRMQGPLGAAHRAWTAWVWETAHASSVVPSGPAGSVQWPRQFPLSASYFRKWFSDLFFFPRSGIKRAEVQPHTSFRVGSVGAGLRDLG